MLARREHYDEEEHEEYMTKECLIPIESRPTLFADTPLGINGKEFVESYFGARSGAKHNQFRKGTTTVAFTYKPKTANDLGGVVVAVDSRATGGQYIASWSVLKILPVTDHMVATMAGGAADCQFWISLLRKFCNLYELREKTQISVRAASRYFANVLHGYRGMGLSIGTMIAGIDKTGPSIMHVSSQGLRIPQKYCAIGSGMLNAFGILDNYWREEMTDEEAVNLGRQAIMHAIYRDKGSGGFCNVTHVTTQGLKVYPPMDADELLTKFANEKGIEPCEPSP